MDFTLMILLCFTLGKGILRWHFLLDGFQEAAYLLKAVSYLLNQKKENGKFKKKI